MMKIENAFVLPQCSRTVLVNSKLLQFFKYISNTYKHIPNDHKTENGAFNGCLGLSMQKEYPRTVNNCQGVFKVIPCLFKTCRILYQALHPRLSHSCI